MVVGKSPAAEPAVAQGDLPAVATVPPGIFPPETVVKLEKGKENSRARVVLLRVCTGGRWGGVRKVWPGGWGDSQLKPIETEHC